MKNFILSISLLLTSTVGLFAQNTANIIIFTQDPMPFYAVVNGIRQNSTPQTNVKITGLTNNTNSVKIVFSDGRTPDIDKNFYFEKMNVEVTAKIANTKNGYKLRYFGEVEMGQAAVNDQQVQIVYQTVDAPITNTVQNTTSVVTEETVISTTTGTGTNANGTSENVNMDVSIGGVGLNMDVNVNDSGMNTNNNVQMNNNVETTYTTTTTTTTTTTNGGVNYNDNMNSNVTETVVYVPGYSGRIGCPGPLSDVNSIKAAIDDEDFSDDRIMVAKQALRGKCLTTDNISSIIGLFDFEDKKVEFAKYAYDYTYDVDNYYKVNKAFSFSSSKEELNEYISGK